MPMELSVCMGRLETNRKMIVQFLSNHDWPFFRQIPKNSTTSFINNQKYQAEFLVVYDDLPSSLSTNIEKAKRILFISEPPSIKTYTASFLSQFGIIITPQHIDKSIAGDAKQIISQLSLPWHYGLAHSNRHTDFLTHDALNNLPAPNKKPDISVMISKKALTPQHKQRMQTAEFLKQQLGSRFHLTGRGYQDVDDKSDIIAPFAYHLVCENNAIANFWTEKLADAYLGYALPFYSGCPNLETYFPEDSFIRVDLSNPQETVKTIESALNNPGLYGERLQAVKKARKLVLGKYNLFIHIEEIIAKHGASLPPLTNWELLHPQEKQASLFSKVKTRIKTVLKQ